MNCYFLIYRIRRRRKINWDRPTGGIVIEAAEIVDGEAIPDIDVVESLSDQRFECGPDEALLIAQVFERYEKRMAKRLHRQWNREVQDFRKLMTASPS